MFENLLQQIQSQGQFTRAHMVEAISICGAQTPDEAYAYIQSLLEDVEVLTTDDKIRVLTDLNTYFGGEDV